MGNSWFWMTALVAVTAYCVIQSIRDFRARRYLWGTAAAISAALLVMMPVQSHVVTVDLPLAAPN